MKTKDIMGITVASATADEVMAHLEAHMTQGHGQICVAYLNAHSSNIAAGNEAYRNALRSFLVLNDGIGVDIAAWLLSGSHFPDNLNGTDFTPAFLAQSKHALKIYLLGARPGIAQRAGSALSKYAPQHRIVGTDHGYGQPDQWPEHIERIRQSGADVLLVAMGNPAQELWMAKYAPQTGCRLVMGVGALFDFLSEAVPRAPHWIRQARMEWIYRLCLEPGRLGWRYLVGNPRFLARLVWAWATRRQPATKDV